MDSFELSKIAGAVLAAVLLIVGPGVIIDASRSSHGSGEVGYILPTDTSRAAEAGAAAAPVEVAGAPAATAPAAGETKAAPAAPASPAAAPAAGGFDAKAVAALVATAKPEDGAAAFKKCSACHQVKKDAPSAVAPNLWGVVNRAKAAHPDFAAKYSEGMKSKGGEWTYENLAAFIHKPKDYVPGTKMIFNGIKDEGEIASIVAYLRTLADTPAPLPN